MNKFLFSILILCFPILSGGKVELLMSQAIIELLNEKKSLSHLFNPLIQSNESGVLEKFIQKEAKFAIVREDVFHFFLKNKNLLDTKYHIIGKISDKVVLYFFSNKSNSMNTIESLQNKKISIGMLGDITNIYLKKILKEQHIPYSVNMKAGDFYHAFHALRDDKIDGIFMFGREKYKKDFLKYIQEYPKGFTIILKGEEGLVCKNNSCYTSYYLIASDSVGQQVMHNIYEQVKPILSKNMELASNLGLYYIDTKQDKYPSIAKSKLFTRNTTNPKFGRTPWMDTAIKEAISGKGSSENVLPMLDLSYKYIRFSKGDKGITTAPNDSKFGSWCAAYICWTLDKSGYLVHKKGRMASQSFRYFKNKLYKKIDAPIFGAITLYTSRKNPLHGHVGYLFGRTKQGKNILLGGNQNNRLKFASYPAKGFGNYRFNGFYIPINYTIKSQDKLTSKDIYKSVKFLNKKYGIKNSRKNNKVR